MPDPQVQTARQMALACRLETDKNKHEPKDFYILDPDIVEMEQAESINKAKAFYEKIKNKGLKRK